MCKIEALPSSLVSCNNILRHLLRCRVLHDYDDDVYVGHSSCLLSWESQNTHLNDNDENQSRCGWHYVDYKFGKEPNVFFIFVVVLVQTYFDINIEKRPSWIRQVKHMQEESSGAKNDHTEFYFCLVYDLIVLRWPAYNGVQNKMDSTKTCHD